MTESTIYIGVNAPKIHQRIIGQLMMRLGMLFYIEKRIPYEPFPETRHPSYIDSIGIDLNDLLK
ncbi:MAG: hypothetical protein H7246_18335 [Phycisphaerae bacterium]|nr:hypothetical protein [Saprospiraceae bacterium]